MLLSIIPVFLAMLLQLINTFTSTGRKRILSILGFLIALFTFLSSFLLVYGIGFQPILFWYTVYAPIFWVLLGFSQFFLVYYAVILAFPDFFSKNKWTMILPIIGFVAYETAAILVPWSELHYNVFLIYNVIYMLIIPLIATYNYLRLDRIRGTPRVKWIIVITVGMVLWFIGYSVSSLVPEYRFLPGLIIPVVFVALAWWIILIGSVLDSRAGKQRTD
jgi:hypothetical protein